MFENLAELKKFLTVATDRGILIRAGVTMLGLLMILTAVWLSVQGAAMDLGKTVVKAVA